jgi:hypothetical protein
MTKAEKKYFKNIESNELNQKINFKNIKSNKLNNKKKFKTSKVIYELDAAGFVSALDHASLLPLFSLQIRMFDEF